MRRRSSLRVTLVLLAAWLTACPKPALKEVPLEAKESLTEEETAKENPRVAASLQLTDQGRRLIEDRQPDKAITVCEKAPQWKTPYMSDTDWFKSGCLIVREDYDSGDAIYFQDTWLAHGLMDRDGFAQIDTLFRRNGSDRYDVYAAVTDGRVLVNYRGQGVSNWWSPFDCDPNQTNPGYKLPVVVAATCGSGNFPSDGYPCETWTKAGTVASPKGSVAFSGTAVVASHVSEYRSAVDQGFFNGLFNLKMFTAGEALTNGKLNLYTLYPSETYEYNGWNCQGDPELFVWTDTPGVLTVDHPASVQVVIDGLQKDLITIAGITCHGLDLQIRIECPQLQQQSAGRHFFMLVGRTNVVQ